MPGVEGVADRERRHPLDDGVDEPSWMPAVTISRLLAVQRWPVEKNAPCIAQSTATSRSASSSTTSGFLPPISSCTRPQPLRRMPAATPAPIAAEPVKVTPRDPRRPPQPLADHASRAPITRLNTPAGTPAREMISASDQALAGTSSAGLHTTVLP